MEHHIIALVGDDDQPPEDAPVGHCCTKRSTAMDAFALSSIGRKPASHGKRLSMLLLYHHKYEKSAETNTKHTLQSLQLAKNGKKKIKKIRPLHSRCNGNDSERLAEGSDLPMTSRLLFLPLGLCGSWYREDMPMEIFGREPMYWCAVGWS